MKIEYFPPLKGEDAVVLIYGNEPARVVALRERVAELVAGAADRFAVDAIAGFEGVDGCQLFFARGPADLGVQALPGGSGFECTLQASSWHAVAGLLEPFCSGLKSAGFQYLDTAFSSQVGLIISTDRGW